MVAEGANGPLCLVGTMIPRWHVLTGYTLQSAILFKLLRSLVVQAFEGRLEAFAGEEVDAVCRVVDQTDLEGLDSYIRYSRLRGLTCHL